MIKQIFKKEWLKVRKYFLILLVMIFVASLYFVYNLNYIFSTIEPESMMWYKFAHFGNKPYEWLNYFLFLFAIIISAVQFFLERTGKRIKILCHLPVTMEKSISLHLGIGIVYITLLSFVLLLMISTIIYHFYPKEILFVYFKDFFFAYLGAIILYLGISSSVIEKNTKKASLKFLLTITFIFVYNKNFYNTSDLLWLVVVVFLYFLVLDSFYSIKEQKIDGKLFKLFYLLIVIFVVFQVYISYNKSYSKTFNRYYIFYSPIIKNFVYQKNFGDHNFLYKEKNNNKLLNRKHYEESLPFVYWRNLDIQNKLPIVLEDKKYDKSEIKKSRLSFAYKPNYLEKLEIKLYPFINSYKNKGMISFPEVSYIVLRNKIKFYDFDNMLLEKDTKEINEKLISSGLKFPIKNIWGKFTNMKSFDLGSLFLDSNNNLFNMRKRDGVLFVKKINYKTDKKLIYVNISENKQKIFAGYAVDEKSNFYLIDYKTMNFKKIDLKEFDYKNMKLQFLSNPKYYQIRFNSSKKYYSYVYDKEFNFIDKIELNF